MDGRLRRNKYYTSYIKRVVPLKAKSAAAALRLNNFDLKFKQAEQQIRDLELIHSNLRNRVVRAIDHEHVSVETLHAEVLKLNEMVPRVTEFQEVFEGLQIEWLALKLNLDSDLDDCISKINALKQEIYIKYGVMHD
ncbi:unnamed protein product [Orchesella dallaii]|uniref:Uncharacterized protein n=1 Tax=Orchesella dallaii TaxID=48710 RepID=A0ABP1QLM2_9HEXA